MSPPTPGSFSVLHNLRVGQNVYEVGEAIAELVSTGATCHKGWQKRGTNKNREKRNEEGGGIRHLESRCGVICLGWHTEMRYTVLSSAPPKRRSETFKIHIAHSSVSLGVGPMLPQSIGPGAQHWPHIEFTIS
jgi:hypothetical protein